MKIVDTVGNNTFCFCAIDGSLVLLPGRGVTVTGQLFGNNHLTVQVTRPADERPRVLRGLRQQARVAVRSGRLRRR